MSEDEVKRKIVLKKLSAYNTVWHPESTVVFKSQKERLVIGRLVNNVLIQLDQECLDLCDKWNFKPDESLLCEEEEEEEEEVAKEEEVKSVVFENREDVVKKYTDGLYQELFPIFKNLNAEIDRLKSEVSQMNTKLSEKTDDMSKLQEKHDIMEQKFKTMKSLFA